VRILQQAKAEAARWGQNSGVPVAPRGSLSVAPQGPAVKPLPKSVC